MMPATIRALASPTGGVGGGGGVFYGWRVLAAASALGFVAFGVVIPGFLALSVPIRAELGLSSAQAAFVVGAAWGVGDIVSLGAGWLADRYGTRRLILAGGLLCGAGFAAMGLAESFTGIVATYTVVASAGRGLGVFPTLMTAVNQWFERRKALALTVVNTAVTGGAAALLPAMSFAETLVGWRMTAFICGGMVCLLTLPAVAVIRSRPEDLGLLPYGAGVGLGRVRAVASSPDRATSEAGAPSSGASSNIGNPPAGASSSIGNPSAGASSNIGNPSAGASSNTGNPSAGAPRVRDYRVGEAVRTVAFVALAVGAVLRTVTSDVLVINQIPILMWKGVAAERTAFYLSLTYFATIPARFAMGLAASWAPPRWLLAGAMLAATVGTAGALLGRGDGVAWLLVMGSALGQGVNAVAWITVGEYFGRRSFGTLVGVMTAFYGINGMLMPALAGAAFDRTGSFGPALAILVVLQAASAGAFVMVRRPTRQ